MVDARSSQPSGIEKRIKLCFNALDIVVRDYDFLSRFCLENASTPDVPTCLWTRMRNIPQFLSAPARRWPRMGQLELLGFQELLGCKIQNTGIEVVAKPHGVNSIEDMVNLSQRYPRCIVANETRKQISVADIVPKKRAGIMEKPIERVDIPQAAE